MDIFGKFYGNMAYYYQEVKSDYVGAIDMCQKIILLASQTGNRRRHSQALRQLAWIHVRLGKCRVAQIYAYEAQKLARVSGVLYEEAEAVRTQALCWEELGHYKQSLSLGIIAQSLLGLCGMSGGEVNVGIMTTQASVHSSKSEYSDAWKIYTEILQFANKHPHYHAITLLNLAIIGVLIGVPKCDVQQNIDLARSIFHVGARVTAACDAILGGLYLREKDLCGAQLLFEKCLQADVDAEIKFICLEKLGNASQWGADYSMYQWTTVFLVYSLKCKRPLQVHKALQFLGDIFLHQKDVDTAITLFTAALEGFTYMDVHQGRAECMCRLGDISNSCGDQLKAVELWMTAKPLFERSSQWKEVQGVEERLACVGKDVLEQ
jgi:tetratricopeptide (TPR) repeat protein